MSRYETITLPRASDDEHRTLNKLLQEIGDRQDRNFLRASIYDGKRAIRQVGTVIPPQYYHLGIVLGWGAKAVDLLARRTKLLGFTWADGDLDSLGYREVWDANMFGSEVDQGLTSSLIHGPAFTINTRGENGEPTSLIHFKDARNATGEWDPRARQLRNLLSVIEWDHDSRQPVELALYLDGLTVSARKDEGKWTVDRSDHPWGVPADVLPYKPRLGRPFGCSRISRPMIGLQDQAIRELIRLEGHMDVFSFPEMVLLGADMSVFKNPDGSQKAAWQVMLGRWKGIPDADDADLPDGGNPRADVKQFPAASPQPHLAALNAFAKLYGREASLPDTALAITDVSNPTSAESYDASQYELIAEAEGATDDWSPGLRRTEMRALAIANGLDKIPDEWRSIDSRWRDPRYQSRSALADAGAKQLASVPWLAETEVGLELLGLDPQQAGRALSERRRAQARQTTTDLIAAARQARGATGADAG